MSVGILDEALVSISTIKGFYLSRKTKIHEKYILKYIHIIAKFPSLKMEEPKIKRNANFHVLNKLDESEFESKEEFGKLDEVIKKYVATIFEKGASLPYVQYFTRSTLGQ